MHRSATTQLPFSTSLGVILPGIVFCVGLHAFLLLENLIRFAQCLQLSGTAMSSLAGLVLDCSREAQRRYNRSSFMHCSDETGIGSGKFHKKREADIWLSGEKDTD